MSKPKKVYPPFEEVQILWECDFPSRPELLESLLKERIENKEKQDKLKEREVKEPVSATSWKSVSS